MQMNYKLNHLTLIALLFGSANVVVLPAGGTQPPTLLSQNSNSEDFGALTQSDRWFFIAKEAIYKGDFDTGIINLRRVQKNTNIDCLREAANLALVAAQSGKDALRNGASTEAAIAIYEQQIFGGPECW
jgi:Xaa-Pro aminopeptidase